MSKLSKSVGQAQHQAVSIDVLEVAHEEIAVLQRTINEQAKLIDSLEHRLGNQARTIRSQANTITMLLERFDVEHGVRVEMA
jgi:uncharacterized coiled-coil protein SlyX